MAAVASAAIIVIRIEYSLHLDVSFLGRTHAPRACSAPMAQDRRTSRPCEATGPTRCAGASTGGRDGWAGPVASPRFGIPDKALPGRTEVQDRAAVAGGALEKAAALPVQHHDLVIVVDRLRIPIRREKGGELHVGRPHIQAL